MYTVSQHPAYQNDIYVYSGENVMEEFFSHLMKERKRVSDILVQQVAMAPLSPADNKAYEYTKQCPICGVTFDDDNIKVQHHDHVSASSSTRRATVAICN